MTENETPPTAPASGGSNAQAPTQMFNWLQIVGFLAITAAIIAGAYFFLMAK